VLLVPCFCGVAQLADPVPISKTKVVVGKTVILEQQHERMMKKWVLWVKSSHNCSKTQGLPKYVRRVNG
jgi:hypothetical protein